MESMTSTALSTADVIPSATHTLGGLEEGRGNGGIEGGIPEEGDYLMNRHPHDHGGLRELFHSMHHDQPRLDEKGHGRRGSGEEGGGGFPIVHIVDTSDEEEDEEEEGNSSREGRRVREETETPSRRSPYPSHPSSTSSPSPSPSPLPGTTSSSVTPSQHHPSPFFSPPPAINDWPHRDQRPSSVHSVDETGWGRVPLSNPSTSTPSAAPTPSPRHRPSASTSASRSTSPNRYSISTLPGETSNGTWHAGSPLARQAARVIQGQGTSEDGDENGGASRGGGGATEISWGGAHIHHG